MSDPGSSSQRRAPTSRSSSPAERNRGCRQVDYRSSGGGPARPTIPATLSIPRISAGTFGAVFGGIHSELDNGLEQGNVERFGNRAAPTAQDQQDTVRHPFSETPLGYQLGRYAANIATAFSGRPLPKLAGEDPRSLPDRRPALGRSTAYGTGQ
ncbi:hypothetical protein GWI33_002014 [Rhynchophorus ferrugineus]|uniref:Uncharacterized protein n=1 Tax=Rhynchophorus ferrugineus TaxID=354439 RepID=A0A834HJW3_RHYFE|nr:hypothetical protein GWI33_002014 [Rhynchophorus ferrugineus]